MKILHLHACDSKWLRRWLRSNLTFFAVASLLLIAGRYPADVPIVPSEAAARDASLDSQVSLPAETDLVLLTKNPPNPVAPQGWRRTSAGWEHVSTWTSTSKTINQLIAMQTEQEPAWIRFVFEKIRSVPPLMVALMQVTAIAVIINVARMRNAT